jgi:hypothetical protein
VPQRTSIDDVRLICPTTATDAQVQQCIDMASIMVDTYLAPTGTVEPTLEVIECYLAADNVCLIDPRATDIGDGDTRVALQRGKEARPYYDRALALDASGTLRALGTRKRTVIKLY